jgi:hypothetical protein
LPYDLRGSSVSVLAWKGCTLLEVVRQARHSVAVCDRHYAPASSTSSNRRSA